jgi:hypothetical protein
MRLLQINNKNILEKKTFEISFFKILAIVVVFSLSLGFPILIFKKLEESANNLLIRKNLETVRNWAEIKRLKNGNYIGLEKDKEILNIFEKIKDFGGTAEIYLSANNNYYCAKTNFIGSQKNKNWCIDSSNYSGADSSKCKPGFFQCR